MTEQSTSHAVAWPDVEAVLSLDPSVRQRVTARMARRKATLADLDSYHGRIVLYDSLLEEDRILQHASPRAPVRVEIMALLRRLGDEGVW